MTLSAAQRSLFVKATKLGSGKQAVALSDAGACALIAIAASDLSVELGLPPLDESIALYANSPPSLLSLQTGESPESMFGRLVDSGAADADTYFSCLAALHKGRLKYENILSSQAVPTIDQVGPRGLLLYGMMPTPTLAALLLWRKWIFDIDNRAGQETGYVFEPILAGAIGGAPASSSKSPVRRRNDSSKGRQVDCILDHVAYEFKLRVTIAASGQGRWQEELDFPQDCVDSGFQPALIVLDPTDDPKLNQLQQAFRNAGGKSYVGEDAWDHLKEQAGPSMGVFVEKYIRRPLKDLLAAAPVADGLPKFSVEMYSDSVVFHLGEVDVPFARTDPSDEGDDCDTIPDDVSDQLPGV